MSKIKFLHSGSSHKRFCNHFNNTGTRCKERKHLKEWLVGNFFLYEGKEKGTREFLKVVKKKRDKVRYTDVSRQFIPKSRS